MLWLSILVSLVAALPLIISLCCGCLLPNSLDDIQCAAVINASEDVVFIEHKEEMPQTKGLIIKKPEGSLWFSVWKDDTMLFGPSSNRRRSQEACRLAKFQEQETKDQTEDQAQEEQKRQEIIKEILYANP